MTFDEFLKSDKTYNLGDLTPAQLLMISECILLVKFLFNNSIMPRDSRTHKEFMQFIQGIADLDVTKIGKEISNIFSPIIDQLMKDSEGSVVALSVKPFTNTLNDSIPS